MHWATLEIETYQAQAIDMWLLKEEEAITWLCLVLMVIFNPERHCGLHIHWKIKYDTQFQDNFNSTTRLN